MAENDVRNNEQQEDLSELIKVRRDKLRDLQDAGKDPFKEVRFDSDVPTATRNAHCEALCISRKTKTKTTEDIFYISVGKLCSKDTVNVCKCRRNFHIRSIELTR